MKMMIMSNFAYSVCGRLNKITIDKLSETLKVSMEGSTTTNFVFYPFVN